MGYRFLPVQPYWGTGGQRDSIARPVTFPAQLRLWILPVSTRLIRVFRQVPEISENAGDWPIKRPIAVRNLSAPVAAPFVCVGRTIEHAGRSRRRNAVGSGMIRFV